jgi:uncharacterized protein YndB with AHSA1/START domain
MSSRDTYKPGPAYAEIEKTEGETWSLVLTREFRHPPTKVWQALTDPAQLREWAPFDSDTNLGTAGTAAKLTTIGAPKTMISETRVTRAEAPKVLEYRWGDNEMRWQLEPHGSGTRLTLWTSINRGWIAMGAAGWQICLDVLDHLIAGEPLGRMVGPETMQFDGWQRLTAEYAKRFDVVLPAWLSGKGG